MNPIHFQFITTTPSLDRYSVERLFALLDDFDVMHRDLILRSAYRCFDLGHHDGYSPQTYREEMYRCFREAFPKAELQGCTEDDSPWREPYVVYALVSNVLVNALADSERGEYGSFQYNQKESLSKYEEALKGDEASRLKAMEWSMKAMKTLEQIHLNRIRHGLAYRLFCEKVVKPLLGGEDAD